MNKGALCGVLTALLVNGPTRAMDGPARSPVSDSSVVSVPSPESGIVEMVDMLPSPLRELVEEVLARNPEVARARAEAMAAAERPAQVRVLPNPMASLTALILRPETRVGPQELGLSISQRLPWFGKLALREQQAVLLATASHLEVEARRLGLVTATRELFFELAFLASQEEIVRSDRATLEHYEQLARARYASGVGLQQEVLKIQAEITKDDSRLLEIASRRATLAAALNALRDVPPSTPVSPSVLPKALPEPEMSIEPLRHLSQQARPEVAAVRARVAAADSEIELAEREFKPDFTLGLGYTFVGGRDDPAGRAMPPPDEGDDILGLTVGIDLPVWRGKLRAAVAEAAAQRSAAEEELRAVIVTIDQTLGDLVARIPLMRQELSLFDELLVLQAEEALRSAEAAYAAGLVDALELLDAERVLLEVRLAAARSRADYLIAVARLEGAVGAPLHQPSVGLSKEAG